MRELTKTDHFNFFDRMRRRMGETFDRVAPKVRSAAGPWLRAGVVPAVEVLDEEEAVHLRVELPGLTKGDFKVELLDDHLTIKGEKKEIKPQTENSSIYSEIGYGPF